MISRLSIAFRLWTSARQNKVQHSIDFYTVAFFQPGVDYIPLLFIQHVKLESAAALGI